MPRTSFGEILKQARERKGYDLSTTARRLRIRPDILRAIEEGDFASMPPRGYTRNMVNAYARFVGLNPTELTRQYLDEAHEYQAGVTSNQPPANPTATFDMGEATRHPRSSRFRDEAPEGRTSRRSRQNNFERPVFEDRNLYGRSNGSDDLADGDEAYASDGGVTPPGGPYGNVYAGPSKQPSFFRSHLPFIIAGVVVIIILIIVLVAVFSCSGNAEESSEDDSSTVPITGVSDTTQAASEEGDKSDEDKDKDKKKDTKAATPPEKATFTYKVESGETAYIEVHEGDKTTVCDDITGPDEESFDVTDTLEFITVNPDYVTLTLDGETVEPEDPNGNGVYTYTVDFNKILDDWNAENGVKSSSSKSSSDSDSSSNSDTSSDSDKTTNSDSEETTN